MSEEKIYVNAVRSRGKGYDVFTSKRLFEQVNRNIVETMFGSDLEYLLKCPIRGTEFFRPLVEWETNDLEKYQWE